MNVKQNLELQLLQKIQEIDASKSYTVFLSNPYACNKFNLGEKGLRGMHLIDKTESEILAWVQEHKK